MKVKIFMALYLLTAFSMLFQTEGCSSRSTGDRILADETFFPKGYSDMVAKIRKDCPNVTAASREQGERSAAHEGLSLKSSSVSYSLKVSTDPKPTIAEIQNKYGPPDSTAEATHYYGGLGLQTDNGKVVAIVIDCEKK